MLFFYQAEDGIRVGHVTGVQTCALPIFFGQNPYARAKRAAEGLLRRVVHVAKGNNSYDQFQWTTLARYVSSASSDNGESYIEIRLNEELSPYLLELRDRYNVIPLLDVLPLQSFNAQRLYEILWHDSHEIGRAHV